MNGKIDRLTVSVEVKTVRTVQIYEWNASRFLILLRYWPPINI